MVVGELVVGAVVVAAEQRLISSGQKSMPGGRPRLLDWRMMGNVRSQERL
jgi:hypothetical protein